jgi:hypothetical protein
MVCYSANPFMNGGIAAVSVSPLLVTDCHTIQKSRRNGSSPPIPLCHERHEPFVKSPQPAVRRDVAKPSVTRTTAPEQSHALR